MNVQAPVKLHPHCVLCGGALTDAGLKVDLQTNSVRIGERSFFIRPKSAEMLHVLIDGYPNAVSHDFMIQQLYGWNEDAPSQKTVNVHAHWLRRVLRQLGWNVKSDYGAGWRLIKLGEA